MKRLVWLGDSLERLREFPPDARRAAGYQLADRALARARFGELVKERRRQWGGS